MDIKLPVLSGIDATKEIREYEKKVHRQPSYIIALTGSVTQSDLDTYKEAGMNGCIEKGCVVSRAMHYLTAQRLKRGKEFLFINPNTSLIADVPESRPPPASHFRHCQLKDQDQTTKETEQSSQSDDFDLSLSSQPTNVSFLHTPSSQMMTT